MYITPATGRQVNRNNSRLVRMYQTRRMMRSRVHAG